MSRGPDAATLIERALVADGAKAGIVTTIDAADWTRWASATFTGARHVIALRLIGARASAWLDCLPEAEFALRGHLVADLAVVRMVRDGDALCASIEALTVEER